MRYVSARSGSSPLVGGELAPDRSATATSLRQPERPRSVTKQSAQSIPFSFLYTLVLLPSTFLSSTAPVRVQCFVRDEQVRTACLCPGSAFQVLRGHAERRCRPLLRHWQRKPSHIDNRRASCITTSTTYYYPGRETYQCRTS